MLAKIISGGQTGADQAGLDAAMDCGVEHGGWIPKGRPTNSGMLSTKYKLEEMTTKSYPKRTEKNILSSDGTVIFSRGTLSGGSALTKRLAAKHSKPLLHLNLTKMNRAEAVGTLSAWVQMNNIAVLNVAGPRASKDPGLYDEAYNVVRGALGFSSE